MPPKTLPFPLFPAFAAAPGSQGSQHEAGSGRCSSDLETLGLGALTPTAWKRVIRRVGFTLYGEQSVCDPLSAVSYVHVCYELHVLFSEYSQLVSCDRSPKV